MNDLVWRQQNPTCSCPSCGCVTEKTDEYVYYEHQYVYKEVIGSTKICGKCTCAKNNDNNLVYSCDREWPCPNTTCHTYYDETYDTNESWFNVTDDCDQFCICNADGTISCATGFEDILHGPNENITNAFIDVYGDHLETINCMGDWTKLIGGEPEGTGIDRRCPSVPRCTDCGLYIPGDTWWTNLTVFNDDAGFWYPLCVSCKCENGSVYLNETYDYVECYTSSHGGESFIYPLANGGCPPNTIKCMDWNNNQQEFILETAQLNGYCISTSNEFQNRYMSVENSYSEIISCEAFVGDKQCIRYNDTYWENGETYLYCCQGDYCNNITVDISQCIDNPYYSEFLNGFHSCYSDLDKKEDELYCEHGNIVDVSLPKRCSVFLEYMQANYLNCWCEWYSKISENLSSSSKQSLENYINYFLDTYNQIYKFYGCDLQAKCNLSIKGIGISANPAYSVLPTLSPTFSPVPSIITTGTPTATTTKTTATATTITIKDSAEISSSSTVKISDALMAIIIIFTLFDIILIIGCVYYILNHLVSRTKNPGNSTLLESLKHFSILAYIGIVLEIIDIITDYIFGLSLIVGKTTNDRLAVLGWLSLMFAIFGLSVFFFKYITYKKIFGYQVVELKQQLKNLTDDTNETVNQRDEIIEEIRYRTMDIDVLSLLNGCIEDIPQTLIVLIVVSNKQWETISVLSISLSMASFILKLSQIIGTKYGCKDYSSSGTKPQTLTETNLEMQITQLSE
eukprot:308538_1